MNERLDDGDAQRGSRSTSCAFTGAVFRACRRASFSERSRLISARAARSRSLCSSEAILRSDTDLCWLPTAFLAVILPVRDGACGAPLLGQQGSFLIRGAGQRNPSHRLASPSANWSDFLVGIVHPDSSRLDDPEATTQFALFQGWECGPERGLDQRKKRTRWAQSVQEGIRTDWRNPDPA